MTGAAKETEVKLDAPSPQALEAVRQALEELGALVGPSTSRRVTDVYLDTRDWWLYRAGVALRRRSEGDAVLLTLKTFGTIQEGMASRTEIEEALPGPPGRLPSSVPGATVGAWLRPLMGTAPVEAKLCLEKTGETFEASVGDLRLKVTTETVRVAGVADGGVFAEAELELISGDPKDLRRLAARLADRLGLEVGRLSKFERAVKARGLRLPRHEEGDDLRLRRRDRFVDAAFRVLRRHFGRMLWHEPGARLGMDPEHLHDMRVATRRLRAALRFFHRGLPPEKTASFRNDLRWLAAALGRVRDLDVYLLRFEEESASLVEPFREALTLYRARVQEDREAARRAMLRVLNSRRYAAFVARFSRFLRTGPPRRPAAAAGRRLVTAVAPSLVGKRLKRVLDDGRSLGPDCPDAALHALRIRCKRLRYACEFLADLYAPEAAEFARLVVGLQDILGENQDACVAKGLVERFALEEPVRSGGRRLALALGQISARHAERARRSRDRFFKAWLAFDRKQVRSRFEKRLAKLTPKPL